MPEFAVQDWPLSDKSLPWAQQQNMCTKNAVAVLIISHVKGLLKWQLEHLLGY